MLDLRRPADSEPVQLSTVTQMQMALGLIAQSNKLRYQHLKALDETRNVLLSTGLIAPRFRHDCDACLFLGTYLGPDYPETMTEVAADLYYHHGPSGGFTSTVLARFGDEPSDYTSGLGGKHFALAEGFRRACQRGFPETSR